MNPLPYRSAAIRLGIACAALLAASAVAASAEEVTKSFTVTGRANVRVETNDGSVRVTSGDSKQVEFRVEYQGYELGKKWNFASNTRATSWGRTSASTPVKTATRSS